MSIVALGFGMRVFSLNLFLLANYDIFWAIFGGVDYKSSLTLFEKLSSIFYSSLTIFKEISIGYYYTIVLSYLSLSFNISIMLYF